MDAADVSMCLTLLLLLYGCRVTVQSLPKRLLLPKHITRLPSSTSFEQNCWKTGRQHREIRCGCKHSISNGHVEWSMRGLLLLSVFSVKRWMVQFLQSNRTQRIYHAKAVHQEGVRSPWRAGRGFHQPAGTVGERGRWVAHDTQGLVGRDAEQG